MKHVTLLNICLALFDGGAAAVAVGATPTGDTAQVDSGTQAGATDKPGGSRRDSTSARRKKSGGLDGVVYGKQPETATQASERLDAEGKSKTKTAAPKPTKDELHSKFRALVSGEFRDIYTEETQRIIDRRFRETKGMEEAMAANKPILELLAQRYQIDDGDPNKLMQAIEQDNAYWSEAAEEAGMSVEQYKQFQKLQRENEAFHHAQRQQQSQQAAQQKYAAWMQEAEQVKENYPHFDMSSECRNPQFLAMIKSGVPVQHAYEVAHLDDIKGGLVQQTAQQTAQQTEKKVVDGIRAKGARPAENGVSSQSGITFKADVSRLTPRDRAEIARRVARGEDIKF